MTDAVNVETGGMGRRVSEVRDLLESMDIVASHGGSDFVDKLASENDWTRNQAEDVYREYLRFLLMAWMSTEMVVPSPAVDQAWHLHLTHTRHYWGVLCSGILQKPLHHEPSTGSAGDAARHVRQYAETLKLYRYLFEEDAPRHVWPTPCQCERRQGAMAASPAGATIAAISIAATIGMLMSGYMLVSLIPLVLGFAVAMTLRQKPHPRKVHVATGSTRAYRIERQSGFDRKDSRSAMDDSGADAAAMFTAWSVDDASHKAAHGHHSTSDHASSTHGHAGHAAGHSCSTSTGHSCGGTSSHSCGSSCGSSCGGGGGD